MLAAVRASRAAERGTMVVVSLSIVTWLLLYRYVAAELCARYCWLDCWLCALSFSLVMCVALKKKKKKKKRTILPLMDDVIRAIVGEDDSLAEVLTRGIYYIPFGLWRWRAVREL